MTGTRKGMKLPPREIQPDTYLDKGCTLYPTCLGNEEYPKCPFERCIEDLADPKGEFYDRKTAMGIRKWFLRKGG